MATAEEQLADVLRRLGSMMSFQQQQHDALEARVSMGDANLQQVLVTLNEGVDRRMTESEKRMGDALTAISVSMHQLAAAQVPVPSSAPPAPAAQGAGPAAGPAAVGQGAGPAAGPDPWYGATGGEEHLQAVLRR